MRVTDVAIYKCLPYMEEGLGEERASYTCAEYIDKMFFVSFEID